MIFLIFSNLLLEPVVTSCDIPTVPLEVAQAMNPVPRPPSPSTCEATQRALRRQNTEQLSTRDTRVLSLNAADVKHERAPLDSVLGNAAIVEGESNPSSPTASTPPQPSSRQLGRMSSVRSVVCFVTKNVSTVFYTYYLFFGGLGEPNGGFSDKMGEHPST